jgi:beta-galactosidase
VEVTGSGTFKAMCNGDATSLEPFTTPSMHTFNGQLVVGIQSTKELGTIEVKVTGNGLQTAQVVLQAE